MSEKSDQQCLTYRGDRIPEWTLSMHCEVLCQQDFMTYWKNGLTLQMDHYLAKEHARNSLGTPTATVRKLLNGIENIAYPPHVDIPKPESG